MRKKISRRTVARFLLLLAAAGYVPTKANASGNVTVSQLGTDALTAVNAAESVISVINAGVGKVPVPTGLLTALQAVQSAAQALTSVTSTNGQSAGSQFLLALQALGPVITPYLISLGPDGEAIAIGFDALTALAPEIAQLTNNPGPASVALNPQKVTAAQARAIFGPKT